MKKLEVIAAFDWLQKEKPIGLLECDNVRGNQVYSFEFYKDWLRNHKDIMLSKDLNNFLGKQYQYGNENGIFRCFADSLPDRWGRKLADLKADITNENRTYLPKKLTDWEYLQAINDATRMGGFRFRIPGSGKYLNSEDNLDIPPMLQLNELMEAAQHIEQNLDKKLPPEERWISRLFNPGSSMGGARPKACVCDASGNIYVAKFPSIKDEYDIGKWEYLASLLAKDCGINTANTKLVKTNQGYSIFLSQRFDRSVENKRIHMASSLTLLGLRDGCGADTGNGYIDIVDFIVSNGIESEKQLEELYRRVAFNICIGNTDDHFRNHAFLLSKNGWNLSPAYDMNPTRNVYQSLNINNNSNKSDINLLYKSHEEYLLSEVKAREIINDVVKTLKYWESLASTLKINRAEMTIIRDRFEMCQQWKFGQNMQR